MPYTQYSMSSLIAEIAALIDDPDNIQWKVQEIRYAIVEALRFWGALTSYWRSRGSFSTVASSPWYDLSVQIPNLRPRTVTFDDLCTEIQYHCFELPSGVSGTGLTSQFTINSIILAVARARNRFSMDAAVPLAVSQQPITAAPDARFYVDENIVYLRHGYWLDSVSGAWSPLRPTDAWAQDGYNPLWTLEPGIPFAFSQSVTRPLEVQLFPPPANDGTIEWLTANTNNFQTIVGATTLGIPDEFCHAIKYAALADLFTMDGESADPQRAKYADERYRQTVAVARNHRSVARVQIGNVPIGLSTLRMLDSSFPRWRMQTGKPYNAGCDLDILAFSAVPNAVYGVTCDVLQSAPIPADDASFLQIGREFIPNLIDYVQHYLQFKLGGYEFFSSLPSYDGFLQSAKDRNAIQAAQIQFLGPLFGMPVRENAMEMGAEQTTEKQ